MLIWRTSKKGSSAVCLSARYEGRSAFFIVIANVTVCRGCDLLTAFLPFLFLPLSLPSALVGKMLLSGKIMVSGSADGRKGEGIENEAEREGERGMGMAHLAAAGPTSDSIPTRSSSACFPACSPNRERLLGLRWRRRQCIIMSSLSDQNDPRLSGSG